MKIRMEVDNKIIEDEVIIRCSELNEDVKNIQIMLHHKLYELDGFLPGYFMRVSKYSQAGICFKILL